MAKKEADPAVKACLESAIRTMQDGIDRCHIQLSRRLSHGDELNLINEVMNTLAWAQANSNIGIQNAIMRVEMAIANERHERIMLFPARLAVQTEGDANG